MRGAVFCMPASGHINPLLAVVRELLRRGEQLDFFGSEAIRAPVEGAGARFRHLPAVERFHSLDPSRGMFALGELDVDDHPRGAALAAGHARSRAAGLRGARRDDPWGGSVENRIRFPVEIVRRVRAAVGRDFIITYRLSMIDLVEGGSTWEEVVIQGKAIESAGATLLNTGIGWHEARVPTINIMFSCAVFARVTERPSQRGFPPGRADHRNRPGGRRAPRERRVRHGLDGATAACRCREP